MLLEIEIRHQAYRRGMQAIHLITIFVIINRRPKNILIKINGISCSRSIIVAF